MDEIRQYMGEPLLSIDSETSVTEAAQRMERANIAGLLVQQNGNYVGIVTEVDFTRRIVAAGLNPGDTKVLAIMSSPLITLDVDQTMDEALICMRRNNIRHVTVTEGEKIVGMISVKDFANYYYRKFRKGKDPVAEFWNNYDCLLNQNTFVYAIEKLLKEIRPTLKSSCETAKSIDQKDSWEKIAEFAYKEGYRDLAEVLRFGETG